MGYQTTKRTLGVLLYPDFELLDVFGPVEMFGSLKDQVTVVMVAEIAGPVESFQKTKVLADHGLDDCPKLDLLLVPGGWGTLQQLENERLLSWLRARAAEVEILMSVCSGSGILAKAGLLDGRPATTNKQSYDTIVAQGPKVDWVREARWVDDELHLRLHPQNDSFVGLGTKFRVVGLDNPAAWTVSGPGAVTVDGQDLVVSVEIDDSSLVIRRTE